MDQSQVVIYPITCQVCAGEGLGAGDQSPQKSVKHCTAFPEQRSVWDWQCARLCVSGAGQRWALPSIPLGMCVCVCVCICMCVHAHVRQGLGRSTVVTVLGHSVVFNSL